MSPPETLTGHQLLLTTGETAITAAVTYAVLGWPVLPIAGMVRGRCGCREGRNCTHPAKHPLIREGTRGATTDLDRIRQWYNAWPWAGVGIVTGARSGLVVLDVDPRHGGNETLIELVTHGLSLPPTLMAETGGGGQHYFFIDRTGGVPNTSGRLPNFGVTPGLDLRGEGGYVVAAPSGHISGGFYQWVDSDAGLAPLPEILRRQRPKAQASLPKTNNNHLTNYLQSAVNQERQRVLDAPIGTRNDALNRAAFALGTFVGAGVLNAQVVNDVLSEAASIAAIPEREAKLTIHSGLQAGISRPRRTPGPTS